jgi:RNA polymerase sigma factor (sigma-70 family)
MHIDEAFEAFVLKYEKVIRGAAYKHLRKRLVFVEDYIYDCYWHLYQKWSYIILHANEETHYVNRLIKNFFNDVNRKLSKENESINHFLSWQQEFEKEESEFKHLISHLSHDEQDIMTMFHLHQFSNSIIAKTFNITEVALRKRIERIHKKLKLNIQNLKEGE